MAETPNLKQGTANPKQYSGKDAPIVKMGQEPGTRYGQDASKKGSK